jgi:hypothetical protein
MVISGSNALYLSCAMTFQDDFSSTDLTVNGPQAFFANMPLSKTLTMNLDVPEPWLVEPVIAVYVPLLVKYILNHLYTVAIFIVYILLKRRGLILVLQT